MQKVILIGGSPCSGKSSLAKALSKKFSIPYIGTDVIRSFMQQFADKSQYPYLFDSVDITPEEYFARYDPDTIVNNQNKESLDVWEGVKKFIDVNEDWDTYIIEGVALLPEQITKYKPADKEIIPMFVIDDNVERLKDVILTRGLWDDANTYSDDVKKQEHIWLMRFVDWLKKEVKSYDLPLITVTNREEVLTNALAIIADSENK